MNLLIFLKPLIGISKSYPAAVKKLLLTYKTIDLHCSVDIKRGGLILSFNDTSISCKQYKRDDNYRRSHVSDAIMRKLISHFARSGRKRCRDANVYPGGSAPSDTPQNRLASSKKGRENNDRHRENLKRGCGAHRTGGRVSSQHIF